jgi:hypothetical protein
MVQVRVNMEIIDFRLGFIRSNFIESEGIIRR